MGVVRAWRFLTQGVAELGGEALLCPAAVVAVQSTWPAASVTGANPLLPVLLPEGAEQYTPPPPDATAADAYVGADWAAEAGLPVERLSRYRVRLGLPGVFATPDPATTPHFGQRAGYYLQQRSSDGTWRDLYFFRLDEFLAQDFALVSWRGFVASLWRAPRCEGARGCHHTL